MYLASKHETTELEDVAEGSIESLLSRYQLALNALSPDCSYFPELPCRLYLANLYTLYRQETSIRDKIEQAEELLSAFFPPPPATIEDEGPQPQRTAVSMPPLNNKRNAVVPLSLNSDRSLKQDLHLKILFLL